MKQFILIATLFISTSVLATPINESPRKTVRFSLNDAQKLVECESTLQACDEALSAAGKALDAKDATIEVQASQLEELTRRNAELEASRDSFFSNPLVWFLAGALAGGLSYGLVQAIP